MGVRSAPPASSLQALHNSTHSCCALAYPILLAGPFFTNIESFKRDQSHLTRPSIWLRTPRASSCTPLLQSRGATQSWPSIPGKGHAGWPHLPGEIMQAVLRLLSARLYMQGMPSFSLMMLPSLASATPRLLPVAFFFRNFFRSAVMKQSFESPPCYFCTEIAGFESDQQQPRETHFCSACCLPMLSQLPEPQWCCRTC